MLNALFKSALAIVGTFDRISELSSWSKAIGIYSWHFSVCVTVDSATAYLSFFSNESSLTGALSVALSASRLARCCESTSISSSSSSLLLLTMYHHPPPSSRFLLLPSLLVQSSYGKKQQSSRSVSRPAIGMRRRWPPVTECKECRRRRLSPLVSLPGPGRASQHRPYCFLSVERAGIQRGRKEEEGAGARFRQPSPAPPGVGTGRELWYAERARSYKLELELLPLPAEAAAANGRIALREVVEKAS